MRFSLTLLAALSITASALPAGVKREDKPADFCEENGVAWCQGDLITVCTENRVEPLGTGCDAIRAAESGVAKRDLEKRIWPLLRFIVGVGGRSGGRAPKPGAPDVGKPPKPEKPEKPDIPMPVIVPPPPPPPPAGGQPQQQQQPPPPAAKRSVQDDADDIEEVYIDGADYDNIHAALSKRFPEYRPVPAPDGPVGEMNILPHPLLRHRPFFPRPNYRPGTPWNGRPGRGPADKPEGEGLEKRQFGWLRRIFRRPNRDNRDNDPNAPPPPYTPIGTPPPPYENPPPYTPRKQ
ncbi:hypothetical protein BKA63DRAFT_180984 [Paraphoma chrysanthemicola]|nr:hypothetical protein BKA63DRAFT_180984 [Paraphoma chrysanthemicola]